MSIPLYLQIAFVVLTFGLLIVLAIGINSARKKANLSARPVQVFWMGSVFWLAITAWIASSGFLADWDAMPPRFPVLLLFPFIAIAVAFRHPVFGQLLRHVPRYQPVLLQSFRIVMEVILWGLFLESIIPVQMTFEGMNFDIAAGLLAIPVAWLLYRSKASRVLVIGYNVIGLVLLTFIVAVAILSTPVPFRQFTSEPANTMVIHLPMIWLPSVVVPIAYFLHGVSLMQVRLSAESQVK